MNWVCSIEVSCPYCGEINLIQVDTSQGDFSTIEDCTVCCRPMTIDVCSKAGEVESIDVQQTC